MGQNFFYEPLLIIRHTKVVKHVHFAVREQCIIVGIIRAKFTPVETVM